MVTVPIMAIVSSVATLMLPTVVVTAGAVHVGALLVVAIICGFVALAGGKRRSSPGHRDQPSHQRPGK